MFRWIRVPWYPYKESFVIIVILAGGSGTRFWPLSRVRHPKQLMSVLGGKSMLQRTVERVLPLQPERVMVITNRLQAKETAAQLDYITDVPVEVIAEPVGRNTAPAVGLAARLVAATPEAVMVVLPADHVIPDEEQFCKTLRHGETAARGGNLVTLGIAPTRPETGYGYIEVATGSAGNGPFPVSRFVEKPNRDRAEQFLASGNFYWNSGMFLWRADVILDELRRHLPPLYTALMSLKVRDGRVGGEELEAFYAGVKSESIDFGVMEKSNRVAMIPASFGWSDVGSWIALPEVLDSDENGNVVINAVGEILTDSRGCLVYGDGKLVTLLGVSNLIIVETPDAFLVCSRERAQEVKGIVDELQRRGLTEYL
jgi:mannose-1-phosphate guanylyltransferase